MAGKVVGWAFEMGRRHGLSPTERFVLVAYADNATEKGKCFPSKREILDKTALGRSSVYRSIDRLAELDLLAFTEDERGREIVQLAVEDLSHSGTGTGDGGRGPADGPSAGEEVDSQGGKTSSHSGTTEADDPSQPGTPGSHSGIAQSHCGNRSNKGTVIEPSTNPGDGSSPGDGYLCNLLVELMAELDPQGRRERVSVKWLTHERLLLTKDERDVEQAEMTLRWALADSFWQSNIRSMSKFREQFGALFLKANRQPHRSAAPERAKPKPDNVYDLGVVRSG
jgi:hypothetical protein